MNGIGVPRLYKHLEGTQSKLYSIISTAETLVAQGCSQANTVPVDTGTCLSMQGCPFYPVATASSLQLEQHLPVL